MKNWEEMSKHGNNYLRMNENSLKATSLIKVEKQKDHFNFQTW